MLHSVTLSDGSIATVPVFNVKAVLLSILHDPIKMQHHNFASGYDLFTGKSTIPVTHYDEIHTGDIWSSARKHYCGEDPNAFPLGWFVFMTRHTLIYLDHCPVHHLLQHSPSSMTNAAAMTSSMLF